MENQIKLLFHLIETTKLNLYELSKATNMNISEISAILIEHEYFGINQNSSTPFETIKKWRNAALFYFNEAYGVESLSSVAKKFNIGKGTLKKYISTWYSDKKILQPYPNFNNHSFDSIDTEEKAYWLGFLYADGYISSFANGKNRYSFELLLAVKDVDHLQKFASFLSYKKELKEKINIINNTSYKSVRLCLCNKYFWNILNSLGCVPRKSLTLKFPNKSIFKSKNLIRHFIRGYFDGDGCCGIYEHFIKGKKYNKLQLNILGTVDFLSKLNEYNPFCKKVYTCNTSKSPSRAFRIQMCSREAFAFMFYIYHDSNIFLKRKYNKFLESCRLYKELYKELVDKIGEDWNVNTELISSITKGEK